MRSPRMSRKFLTKSQHLTCDGYGKDDEIEDLNHLEIRVDALGDQDRRSEEQECYILYGRQ
jgi:hypothetical protein